MKYFEDKVELASFLTLTLAVVVGEFSSLVAFFSLLVASLALISTRRRDVAVVFLTSIPIGLAYEELGVHTGIPFGRYTYHFPPYVLGVPIFVILAWGVFSAVSYLAVMDFPLKYKLALFPLLMVAIDVPLDPMMVHYGLWTWAPSWPEWYGVPLTNYLGWYVVSLTVALAFPLFRSRPTRTVNPVFVIPYTLMVVLNALPHVVPALVVPFAVGAGLVVALGAAVCLLARRLNSQERQPAGA